MDAATGNERRPTVAPDMREPASGVMRMSADDDDQADQQRELADLGTAIDNSKRSDRIFSTSRNVCK